VKNIPALVQWVHLHKEGGQPETVCEKMYRNTKGIIFDFDGTLYDNSLIAIRLIGANPVDLFLIHRERLIRSRFAGRDFLSADNYYKLFFSEMGKGIFGSPQKARAWYLSHYMPRMVNIMKKYYKPRQGVNELLRRLDSPASPKLTAIYSDYPLLKERMEAINLSYTRNIRLYGPEAFGAQKPAVRPFLQIAKDMGLKPEEILVIGDRENTDGLGAFNAGMHFFCLETGNKRFYLLDPYRRRLDEEPQGPNLLMYAGRWEELIKLLLK